MTLDTLLGWISWFHLFSLSGFLNYICVTYLGYIEYKMRSDKISCICLSFYLYHTSFISVSFRTLYFILLLIYFSVPNCTEANLFDFPQQLALDFNIPTYCTLSNHTKPNISCIFLTGLTSVLITYMKSLHLCSLFSQSCGLFIMCKLKLFLAYNVIYTITSCASTYVNILT